MSLGPNGAFNGFISSPTDAWHQDITNAPIDPTSANVVMVVPNGLRGYYLHPDFGSNFGIPYTVVDSSTTPAVPVNMTMYADDSDITPYPFPPTLQVEGGLPACPFDAATGPDGGDHHAIAVDRNKCVAYEVWRGSYCGGKWSAANGTIWDLTKDQKRPYGLTSVDAAGLSVLAGLIRYDEILAGQINHAIRFTSKWTRNDGANGLFIAPATHAAGNNWSVGNPIIGMRIRLRADFDISGFSTTNQIILKAMKKYGMILADNGSTMFFQGTPDSRWNDDDLNNLKRVPSSAFDMVQAGPAYNANNAPTGQAPIVNSFTASSTQIVKGASVTLTPVVTDASYSYIDSMGLVRGPVSVTPAATTTYTLVNRNTFGTSTASLTVNVSAAPVPPPISPKLPTVEAVTIAELSGVGGVYVFTANAKLSNGSTQDVTRLATWTSSNPDVASINAGKLSFQRSGSVVVTAQDGSKVSQPITVKAIVPMRIEFPQPRFPLPIEPRSPLR